MLSIVVQGPVFHGNLVEVATHCRHWRELFPAAEIVFVVSVSDILVCGAAGGVIGPPALIPRLRHDGHLQSALHVIAESCDVLALAEPALPLPAIKSDRPDKLNNQNLQLAAAKLGLALAKGEFVLRTRSDLLFLDRSFLDQFEEGSRLGRGDAGVFGARVLIAPYYTLNPFTVERMPLHFSDWFHFGRADDVRRIWQAPPATLHDSIHYKSSPHAPGSNAAERLFNTRLAVEQHILYHCFKPAISRLDLDFHNDQRSVDLCMDILVDNFTVCDPVAARCVFNKYSSEFTNPEKLYHCITREDWLAMAKARDVDYRTTLAHRLREAADGRAFAGGSGLPRTYTAAQLQTNDGLFLNGEIVSVSPRGTLFFGPYVTVGPGSYLATVDMRTLEGAGKLILKVTGSGGAQTLAQRAITVEAGSRPALTIAFQVPPPQATRLEVVCDFDGFRQLAAAGVTISEAPLPPPGWQPGLAGQPAGATSRTGRKTRKRQWSRLPPWRWTTG